MIREPKMLPWLAKEEGLPLPVARAIWQDVMQEAIVSKHGNEDGDTSWRQVEEFRRRLKAHGSAPFNPPHDAAWMLPLPVFLAWVDCQNRLFRSAWLAWARALRMAPRCY